MLPIQAYLFDLGNVIVDLDLEATPRALMELIREDVHPMDAAREFHSLEERFEIGLISEDAFINGVLQYTPPATQALDVVRAWNAMLLDIPLSRLEALERLNKKYPVYLISNTNVMHIHWVQRKLEELVGTSCFDPRFARTAYYSHELGLSKPDPEVFQYIIKDASIHPEQTLYLDDTLDHVATALKLGFKAAQLPPETEWLHWMKESGLPIE